MLAFSRFEPVLAAAPSARAAFSRGGMVGSEEGRLVPTPLDGVGSMVQLTLIEEAAGAGDVAGALPPLDASDRWRSTCLFKPSAGLRAYSEPRCCRSHATIESASLCVGVALCVRAQSAMRCGSRGSEQACIFIGL